MQHAKSTATGPAVPASVEKSFAVTQATWRFLANERVTPKLLVEPLQQFAKEQIANDDYALAVIDWSKLDYKKHTAKHDITRISHKEDIGYELASQLLVETRTGQPVAPIQMHLKTADGFLSTANTPPPADTHHLEQVLPLMREADEMGISATIIHVIDREADSVFHLRAWLAAGFKFLVRGDDDRIVRWRNEHVKCLNIKDQLEAEGAFQWSREVTIKGKKGIQYVSETEIILDRPAKRKVAGRSVPVPGEAITLRLVMAKVIDPVTKKELAAWYLLTNVPMDVSSSTVALWYYWRWEIESYFKLMKSGGQELEHWQQESGLAILKRLLVASMAVAFVWQLQRDASVESTEFQKVLVRLSGKRLARGRSPTPGVLLSGLFVFFRILDFLDHINFDLSQIAHLKTSLAQLVPGLIKNV
jgi:hypothetical protein